MRPSLLRLAFVFSLAFCSFALGQVSEPIEAKPANLVTLTTEVEGRWMPAWLFDADAEQFELKVWPDGKSAVLSSGLPGSTRIVVLVPADDTKDVQRYVVKATGTPTPTPPQPPTPPGPTPPTPPTPEPPTPAPIPYEGFRVLIVYEAMDTLSRDAYNVIHSKTFRDFLDANCVTEEGGNKGYRIYDDDADVSEDYETWQKAMAKVPDNATLPYMLVSNGKTGWEGSISSLTEAQVMEIWKKHATAK